MKNDWADFFYLVRNVAELTVDSPMDTLEDIFADIRDSEEIRLSIFEGKARLFGERG